MCVSMGREEQLCCLDSAFEALSAVLLFVVSFVDMDFFFIVHFSIGGGGAGDLDFMEVVFFAVVTSTLSLKTNCLNCTIFFR